MYIEKIGECGLIQKIQNRFPAKDRSVVLGIGDDGAVIRPSRGKELLLSTDTLREDIHFKRRYCTFYDMGWKAVAVSISDIAAMGGVPRYLLLSIAVPSKTSVKDLERLIEGVADITTRYGLSLIGGNVSRSKDGVTIDTTVIGELTKGSEVVRSGASVGDLIYVTGMIGNSGIGLSLLESSSMAHSVPVASVASFVSAHLRPTPRVREGAILASSRVATAMIDISDGLLADLGHVCEQSDVGASIQSSFIPQPKVPDRLKRRLAKDPLFYALYGGEDYELLFTIRRKDKGKLEAISKREKINVTCIGEIVLREKGIRILGEDGVKRIRHAEGYDHFRTYGERKWVKGFSLS